MFSINESMTKENTRGRPRKPEWEKLEHWGIRLPKGTVTNLRGYPVDAVREKIKQTFILPYKVAEKINGITCKK